MYFYDLLEKSNLFLENVMDTRAQKMDDREVEWLFKNVIGDGGVWTMMVNLIDKYGVVPESAMPESYNSENTRMMVRLINRKLREAGINIREQNDAGKNLKELRQN